MLSQWQSQHKNTTESTKFIQRTEKHAISWRSAWESVSHCLTCEYHSHGAGCKQLPRAPRLTGDSILVFLVSWIRVAVVLAVDCSCIPTHQSFLLAFLGFCATHPRCSPKRQKIINDKNLNEISAFKKKLASSQTHSPNSRMNDSEEK